MFDICRYTHANEQAWNRFVEASKNGTFLLNRAYMDYHEDRFQDCSLLFYQGTKLYALLPAHVHDDVLFSHFGLTYGGLVMDGRATAADVLTLFQELNIYLKEQNIHKVVYRPTPSIYHLIPAEEDLYALFNGCQARLTARDLSSTIVMDRRLKWSHGRKYGINRCIKNGIAIERSDDYAGFWKVLTENLSQRYNTQPVHSLKEIELLSQRFPENIRLYVAKQHETVLGGTVVYLTKQVVHTQYISASPEGKQLGVLDFLFDHLLNKEFADSRYFDFGKSTEQGGRILNASLIFQKEGFGGRGTCYDTYEWSL